MAESPEPARRQDRFRRVAPAAAAGAALRARFGAPEAPGAWSYPLAPFQWTAAARLEEALARWGGALLADAVGLGKSYVALRIIEAECRRGGRVAVVVPAALRRDWAARLRRLPSAGRSSALVTHAGLSRGRRPAFAAAAAVGVSAGAGAARGTGPELVVVDEAHAFRNPATRRYRALAELCAGARVLLLSATPVNNSPRDLYFLLRLFADDAAFRPLGIADLATALLREGATRQALRPLLAAVLVRRTRAAIRRAYGTAGPPLPDGTRLRFPERAAPHAVRYRLDDVAPGFCRRIHALLRRLTFAAHQPERPAAGMGELIRTGFLKRLESSLHAGLITARRQARFQREFLEALDAGRRLTPRTA
jgi:hypothetical protein